MNTTTHSLVQKLWNYCNVLRDDGMSYGDYVEQLTYLLFLKMADERSQPPYNQTSIVPAAYAWPTLLGRDGARDCALRGSMSKRRAKASILQRARSCRRLMRLADMNI